MRFILSCVQMMDKAVNNRDDEMSRPSSLPVGAQHSMSASVLNPDFEKAVQKALLDIPFAKWLGLRFTHVAPGSVDLEMPWRDEITFDGQTVQAGPIGALLDFAGGAAAYTLAAPRVFLATTDYSVKLLVPARGERLVGKGRVLFAKGASTVSRADVFAEAAGGEVLVATGLVSMRLVTGQT